MELRHLRYFIAVAEELHFGRAAKRMHIAQPPLSQQIKTLENELGTPLFYRTKHTVELTQAGELLLPHARTVIAQAEHCVSIIRQITNGNIGRIHIGYVDETVHFVFPALLKSFRHQYPDVEIILSEMHSNDQANALLEGTIDFGFGYLRSDAPKINMHPLLKGKMLLALPDGNPLCSKQEVRLKECSGQPFIFPIRKSSPNLYDQLLSLCHTEDLLPDIRYTAEHIYTVMGLVRAGLGITLFPEFLQQNEWHGVTFRPIKGVNLQLELLLSWNETRSNTTAHKNFISMATQLFS